MRLTVQDFVHHGGALPASFLGQLHHSGLLLDLLQVLLQVRQTLQTERRENGYNTRMEWSHRREEGEGNVRFCL